MQGEAETRAGGRCLGELWKNPRMRNARNEMREMCPIDLTLGWVGSEL